MTKLLRPLTPGDVVVAYCAWLGEWTAAQVLRETYDGKRVEVVDLDWSSPEEPTSITEIDGAGPLASPWQRADRDRFAQASVPTLLPRCHRILGNAPLRDVPPGRSLANWNLGYLLDVSRRQAAGLPIAPWLLECEYRDLDRTLAERGDQETLHLHLYRIDELDCAELVDRFPRLVGLGLYGSPYHPFRPYTGPENGVLTRASALGRLSDLEDLSLQHVYGMTAADVPSPVALPRLSGLIAVGIPEDFAKAVRATWRPVAKEGVQLAVRKARTPAWIAEHVRRAP